MKLRLAVALAVGLQLAPGWSRAHSRAAHRSITVQVEDRAVVLLVTWTAPTGLLAQLMMARATLLSPENPRQGFERLMAARALAPVAVTLDSHPLDMSRVRTKLTLDHSSQRRHTVAVLVTIPLRRLGRVRVDHDSPETTRLAWSDKTTAAVSASSSVAVATYTRDALSIELARP